VIATKTDGTRKLFYENMLKSHTGNAFFVKAGQVIRIEQRPKLGKSVSCLLQNG
jgi:hypothetical protein